MQLLRTALLYILLACPMTLASAQDVSALPDSLGRRIDQLFATVIAPNSPGCAVGIARDGKTVYSRGYGSTNLEYGIPITGTTVFESGSVAEEFTAGALVLLAQDGKLSFDDDIRTYLPEVPSFGGQRITIRHLLTHTSGLRDQWGLLAIEGRGPGTQVHSPATTLDLVAHQKMLNFVPGTEYLYSSTGFALAGIIVERVSGQSLETFTQERLFTPLGMTHTHWRTDFTEVIKGRATAYSGTAQTGFHIDMPFTNMIGSEGLLSTVGDWLIWNENFVHPRVGGPAWVDAMQTRGTLASGRTITYALGLEVLPFGYPATREMSHTGSTAGYQTFLARSDQGLSIAVMCNLASLNPATLARQALMLLLPNRGGGGYAGSYSNGRPLTPAQMQSWSGFYADSVTGDGIEVVAHPFGQEVRHTGSERANGFSITDSTHAIAFRTRYELLLSANPAARRIRIVRDSDTTVYRFVGPSDSSATALAAYVGSYASDELDIKLGVAIKNDGLVVLRRPNDQILLRPIYKDGFTATGGLGTVRFTRDASGTIIGLAIFAEGARDVRFKKVSNDPMR